MQSGAMALRPLIFLRIQNSQAVSEPVILEKNWKRYQIDVDGVDLSAIEFPFGFIVERGEGQENVAFSLRDVTYDAKIATNPMPLDTTNATSSLPISMRLTVREGISLRVSILQFLKNCREMQLRHQFLEMQMRLLAIRILVILLTPLTVVIILIAMHANFTDTDTANDSQKS